MAPIDFYPERKDDKKGLKPNKQNSNIFADKNNNGAKKPKNLRLDTANSAFSR